MLELYDQIQAAAAAVRTRWKQRPRVGIVLGTGLGSLAQQIEQPVVLDYSQIPHFLRTTAHGHAGRLVCGQLQGLPVIVMEGRFHMYEGYPLQQITLPVRVMRELGAELLVVTNASGGMNPYFRCGDLMVIDDHINLMGGNPLIGINDDRLGPRFPDMCQPYDAQLIADAMAVAREQDMVLHRGVFVAVAGPNLETRAEYRFLRAIGADAVGHVDGPRSPGSRSCRFARDRLIDHHRPLFSGHTEASSRRRNHRYGGCCGAKIADAGAGDPGPIWGRLTRVASSSQSGRLRTTPPSQRHHMSLCLRVRHGGFFASSATAAMTLPQREASASEGNLLAFRRES